MFLRLIETGTAWVREKSWLFQLAPLDTSTPQGRSRERYRRIAWTSLTSLASKAISVATVILSARWTINYLGAERYGLWMTITSVVSMLGFADLGMGNGLLNAVSHAHGKQDRDAIQKAVASAFYMLLAMAGLLTLAGLLCYPWVPWAEVFNVKSGVAAAESGPSMAVFLLCFVVGLPLGAVTKIYLGFQEGFMVNLWQVLSNLGALACIGLAVQRQASLPVLVLALSGPPAVVLGLSTLYQFFHLRPWLRPRFRHFSWPSAKGLMSRGLLFVGFSIMAPVAFYSDNLVVAHVISAEAVANYAVTAKLFNISTLLIGMVTASLWPAYGEAYARNDFHWLRSALTRTLKWGFFSVALPSVLIALGAPWMLRLWLGRPIEPGGSLLLALAIWSILSSLGFAIGNFLAGVNMLKYDLIVSGVMTALALGLKIVLTRRMGVPGVVWGVNLAYILTFIPSSMFIPRLFKRMEAGKPPSEDTLWLS